MYFNKEFLFDKFNNCVVWCDWDRRIAPPMYAAHCTMAQVRSGRNSLQLMHEKLKNQQLDTWAQLQNAILKEKEAREQKMKELMSQKTNKSSTNILQKLSRKSIKKQSKKQLKTDLEKGSESFEGGQVPPFPFAKDGQTCRTFLPEETDNDNGMDDDIEYGTEQKMVRPNERNDPNATIKIKNVDTDERFKREFVFPIWHLSARRVPIVLGFGIEPVAHKTFNFLNDANVGRSIIQNDELIMINYEIEITCEIRLVEKNFVIGSAFYQQQQLNGGQDADVSITVQLYDTETVAACDGTILIDIHKYEDNHDYLRPLSMSKNIFLLNNAFEIDMQSGAIHTLLIPNANAEDDLHSSDEASWDSTTPTRTSTAEFTKPALTAKSKKRKKADETADERIEKLKRRLRCVICMDKTRNILFTPCKHACVCDSCAEKIMNSPFDAGAKLCPYCRTGIEETTKFYLP
ncbi:hypothetical protein niasHS_009910 [Heterodera schachtii]|uniref:RING-type domain-containing protein n=1 Tax=Heterodera schachtii TaxID=97005 RepID=A0ABD2JCW4_HETSC